MECYEESDHRQKVMEELEDVREIGAPPAMHKANVFVQIQALIMR